jgi:hypothetical protein
MTSTMIRATVPPFLDPAWQRSVRDAMPLVRHRDGCDQAFAVATAVCHDVGSARSPSHPIGGRAAGIE